MHQEKNRTAVSVPGHHTAHTLKSAFKRQQLWNDAITPSRAFNVLTRPKLVSITSQHDVSRLPKD